MPYKDPEKAKEHRKEYYLKNRERFIKQHKRYYQQHKAEANYKSGEWYKNHHESAKKGSTKYYQVHKKKYLNRAYKHRKKKIDWFLAHLGTDRLHCDRCRYDKSLAAIQIHHTNPKGKEGPRDQFSVWLRQYSFEHFQQKILETDFLILCANCHAEYHAGLWK
jgi:hypothetical protein